MLLPLLLLLLLLLLLCPSCYFFFFSVRVAQTLRAIDALHQATFNRVGVPANWKEGEDVLVGTNVSGFRRFPPSPPPGISYI